mmetsp:Transcript_30155/g.59044  ORF Transcript_30155/g.59044 Transcript_30155/m.59044 type:complete len:211 (-) Transcript_30155:363-995(-)
MPLGPPHALQLLEHRVLLDVQANVAQARPQGGIVPSGGPRVLEPVEDDEGPLRPQPLVEIRQRLDVERRVVADQLQLRRERRGVSLRQARAFQRVSAPHLVRDQRDFQLVFVMVDPLRKEEKGELLRASPAVLALGGRGLRHDQALPRQFVIRSFEADPVVVSVPSGKWYDHLSHSFRSNTHSVIEHGDKDLLVSSESLHMHIKPRGFPP